MNRPQQQPPPDDHKPHPSNIGKVIMLVIVLVGVAAWLLFDLGLQPAG